MEKPICDYLFLQVKGIWRDVLGTRGDILADVLSAFDLLVDDKAEYVRYKDYTRGLCIIYRAYGGKITLTMWKLR